MPVIRIDDNVMRELESHAVKGGLVFGTPNQVLRNILGLDGQANEPREPEPEPRTDSLTLESKGLPTTTNQLPNIRVTGRRLLREHKDLPQDIKPYSDRDGVFYEWPKDFPAILFDSGGYVIFRTEGCMLTNPHLRSYSDKRKVNIRNGISTMPYYVRCPHTH